MIEIENKEDHRQKNIMSKERSDNNVGCAGKVCVCLGRDHTQGKEASPPARGARAEAEEAGRGQVEGVPVHQLYHFRKGTLRPTVIIALTPTILSQVP